MKLKCPKCKSDVDATDRQDGSRLKCPGCGASLKLKHTAHDEEECWPLCFEASHWKLRNRATRVRAGIE